MADWVTEVEQQASQPQFTERFFPVLHNGLLRDQDILVHSIGCSVWTTLGHELGWMAIVECPAPESHGPDIRSDCAWFSRSCSVPACLIEFERYDGSPKGQTKLENKLGNLLQAAQRWSLAPELLVLSAWTQGIVSPPDIDRFHHILKRGFTTHTGALVTLQCRTQFILNRFIFEKTSRSALKLNRLCCERLA